MATEHTHYTWDDRSKRSWGKEREGKEVDLGLLLRDIRVVCSQGQIQPWYCSLCSLLTVQFAHCTFPWHFCSLWHFHDTFAHCDISMTLLLTVTFPWHFCWLYIFPEKSILWCSFLVLRAFFDFRRFLDPALVGDLLILGIPKIIETRDFCICLRSQNLEISIILVSHFFFK